MRSNAGVGRRLRVVILMRPSASACEVRLIGTSLRVGLPLGVYWADAMGEESDGNGGCFDHVLLGGTGCGSMRGRWQQRMSSRCCRGCC